MNCTTNVRPAEDDLEALNGIYNYYVQTSHVTFDVDPISMAGADYGSRNMWTAAIASTSQFMTGT